MNLRIKVRGQYNPKIIPANTLVETNRVITVIRQIKDLREHEEFLWKGAWYQVISMVPTGEQATS